MDFRNTEEFAYAAMAASALKKAIAEILMYVESQKGAYEELTKKSEEQTKDKYSIGG